MQKKHQTKKVFEDILNNYKDTVKEILDLKELFILASQEKNEEIINDCNFKIGQIYEKLNQAR